MYWFGKDIQDNGWMDSVHWSLVREKKEAFAQTSIEEILDCLDGFSEAWKPGSDIFEGAVAGISCESPFTREEIVKTLSLLPALLSRRSLEKRISAELGQAAVLDRFVKTPSFDGRVKASPLGTVLHVTAGNVFLSSIDSLVMGLVTKNVSILKVSGQNKFFPLYFAEVFRRYDLANVLCDKFSVLYWRGGDAAIEAFLKNKVNAIIAWGGEEMIASYKKDLSPRVKFLDFGPKISLQVVSREALEGKDPRIVARRIVDDVVPWNQGACASPQDLYIQAGLEETDLLRAIHAAFSEVHRGPVASDEATEILKEKYRGYYSELMEEGKVFEGASHLIHFEKDKFLRPSPLNHTLIVKRFNDEHDLFEHLEPFSYYLQSCAYLLAPSEKERYLGKLAAAGVKRFAPLGTITWGMEGAPHDGRLVLRELVHLIGDEARAQDYGEEVKSIQTSSALKNHFEEVPHPKGYVFSSGGTTGEPKFVHFSYEEFDYMTDMLAMNFRAQGIRSGMMVANLFVAGNLWSSFLAVEKALQKIGAVQLPIGGLCPGENILYYLKKFKPEVVLGLPSLLVLNAELSESKGLDLKIPKILYAGEALSESRQNFLKRVWGTEYFGSSGYASVDAGVIGYQCEFSGPGEHHLFSDFIDMKIIDDEAIVTSICRSTMPIVNYSTGDRVAWLPECVCGSKDKRFKLLGRVDNLMQIWSCRLLLSDIERSIQEVDRDVLTYQIRLFEVSQLGRVKEKMEISFEKAELDTELLLEKIYHNSRDLKDTLSLEEFANNTSFKLTGLGEIPRNTRTGKISVILDQRR